MSIIIQRFPICDGCRESYADFIGCDNNKQLREEMRKAGWHRLKGNDLCNVCVEQSTLNFNTTKRGLA